jgi:hypothetical protein
MQLKLQRSQRTGGIVSSKVHFCLDVRADYSPEERANIRRYGLGNEVIYNSQAARKHLEKSKAQLDRVDNPSLKDQWAGVARGAISLALAKMQLNISIDSLARGHHIECKDLEELLEAENTVREACKNVTKYLDVAATFDGSEIVIEYEKGEEKVHVTQGAAPLLANFGAEPAPVTASAPTKPDHEPTFDFEQKLREFWSNPQYRKLVVYGGGILLVLFFVRSCF